MIWVISFFALGVGMIIFSFIKVIFPRAMNDVSVIKFVNTRKKALILLMLSLLLTFLGGKVLSIHTERLNKEMAIRNDLTEKIIDIYPIPFVDFGSSSQIGMGFKLVYLSVQDALAGHNVDNVYNIVVPDFRLIDHADMNAHRQYMERQVAVAAQLSVKPNPNYVANGVTAVLEVYTKEHNRIRNRFGYILVNDNNELKTIEDNIQNVGTIIVLMRYNASSNSYKTKGGSNSITLNQEGMSIYFYDCKKGVVFDNFTILADALPENFKNYGGSTSVTAHVDTINNKLKTNLKGELSFEKILRK